MVDQIKKYRTVLTQLDREFPPKDFPMYRLIANYPDEFGISKEEADRMFALADELDAKTEAEAADGASGDSATEEAQSSDDTQPADDSEPADDSGEPAPAENETASAVVAPAAATASAIGDTDTQLLLDAQKLYESADLESAREKYEAAFKGSWAAKTLDDSGRETLLKHIRYYRILLGQLDQPFPPKDFAFGDFVKKHAADFGYTDDEAEHLFAK